MLVREAKVYVVETGSFRPVIVELLTDEGINGIGEGAVGFGIGCNAAATMIVDLAREFVIGKDPARIMDIWNDFYYHTFWGKGAGAIFYAAASALEIALWDIKGKCLGAPIYELFGGKQRDVIDVYANDWSYSHIDPHDIAKRAAEVVRDGFKAIKLYPLGQIDHKRNLIRHIKNRAVDRETERRCLNIVKEVRNAIGDDIDLLVDASAEGTTETMIRIGQAIEEYRPFFYEEPLDIFDIDAYQILKAKVNIPIATGERLYTRYGFRRLIETRGVDIVQPDPGTTGGIMETWRIASMAEVYQMRIAPHNCGGPVLTAACIQLSACLSNFIIQEVFPYRPDIHYHIVNHALEYDIENSRLPVPDRPGLGIELNHRIVDQFLVARVL
jgi:galactonate dehydratase